MIAALIGLGAAFLIAAVALFSAHIPVLRDLAGSAPLVPDPLPLLAADTDPDYAATQAAGYCEDVETWAARCGITPAELIHRATTLPLPAPRKEAS